MTYTPPITPTEVLTPEGAPIPWYAQPPFPSGPADLVPVQGGEDIIDVMSIAAEGALPASVAVADLVPALGVGVVVETALLNNPHWDNFWIGVGARVDDAWHKVADWLHGGQQIDAEQMRLQIGLRAAMDRRLTRQLLTKVTAKLIGQLAVLAKAILGLRHLVAVERAHADALAGALLRSDASVAAQARAHADAKALQTYEAALAHDAVVVAAVQQWAVHTIAKPLLTAEVKTEQRLAALQHHLPAQIATGAALAAATAVRPIAQHLAQLQQQVNKLQTEQDDCNEPMCETVGPKSDWGKLLKRFAPSAIFALLAELAALHPDEVERATESLAQGIGPIIERWAEQWTGLLPGSASSTAGEIAKGVGSTGITTGL